MGKRKINITLDDKVFERGKFMADLNFWTFSAYIKELIVEDYEIYTKMKKDAKFIKENSYFGMYKEGN